MSESSPKGENTEPPVESETKEPDTTDIQETNEQETAEVKTDDPEAGDGPTVEEEPSADPPITDESGPHSDDPKPDVEPSTGDAPIESEPAQDEEEKKSEHEEPKDGRSPEKSGQADASLNPVDSEETPVAEDNVNKEDQTGSPKPSSKPPSAHSSTKGSPKPTSPTASHHSDSKVDPQSTEKAGSPKSSSRPPSDKGSQKSGSKTVSPKPSESVKDASGQRELDPSHEKSEEKAPEGSTVELKEQSPDVTTKSKSEVMQTQTDDASPEKSQKSQPIDMEDAPVTAKFHIRPTQQTVTIACALGQAIDDIKEYFASELKLPQEVIEITYGGKPVDGRTKIHALGARPNALIEFELNSLDPVAFPLKHMPQVVSEMHMPDVITVKVPQDDGTFHDVVVEIIRQTSRKPFLGGYRNTQSGLEFHHASSQTTKKQRPPPVTATYCRDTQTYEVRTIPIQTTKEMSTQMTGVNVYVSNITDKIIHAKTYVTADELATNRERAAIIIQKYLRRWLAQAYVKRVRHDFDWRLRWEKMKEEERLTEKERRMKREYERRMNPKTKEDFDLLYQYFERWRQEETATINANFKGAERKAALANLLDQETQILASIQKHKIGAANDGRSRAISTLLERAAAPKTWKAGNGSDVAMDTPYTIRARELMDIHKALAMRYVTQDERLDILLTLKQTVREYDTRLTRDLIELVDREADLLMRGMPDDKLHGLRTRISTLFLQFAKQPTFNPEIARHLKVPADPQVLRNNVHFCRSCGKYMASSEFPTDASKMGGTGIPTRCRACIRLDNVGRTRLDLSFYKDMLNELRRGAADSGINDSVVFLLTDSDLQILVEQVWGAQSALSGWSDLADLTLMKWDPYDEWSPWNCVLLTRAEADAHAKIEDVSEAYGRIFKHKVAAKQALARTQFSKLLGMTKQQRQRAADRQRSAMVQDTQQPQQQQRPGEPAGTGTTQKNVTATIPTY